MISNTHTGVLTTASDHNNNSNSNSQNGLSNRAKPGSARPVLSEQASVRKIEIVNALFGEVGDLIDGNNNS